MPFRSPRVDLMNPGRGVGTSILGRNTEPPFTLLDILGNQQGPGPALEDLKTMLLEPGGHPPLFPSLQEGTTPEEKISGMMFDFMPGGGVGSELAGGLLGQTLFHAGRKQFQPAPNKPFGEFLSRFISSGVGDQWFGYGHYLAEEKKVGEYYRMLLEDDGGGLFFQGLSADEVQRLPSDVKDMLLSTAHGTSFPPVQGYAPFPTPPPVGTPFADEIRADAPLMGLIDEHIGELQRLIDDNIGPPHMTGVRKETLSALKKIKDNPESVELQRGVLMEVEIDDSAIPKMLDWDAPLEEQSEEVREILQGAYDELGVTRFSNFQFNEYLPEENPNPLLLKPFGEYTGEEIYQDLGEKLYLRGQIEEYVQMGSTAEEALQAAKAGLPRAKAADRGKNFNDKDVSAFLSYRGMPGLRFLDQFSKEGRAEKLTRNYVVFPGQEDWLNIKDIADYGIPN